MRSETYSSFDLQPAPRSQPAAVIRADMAETGGELNAAAMQVTLSPCMPSQRD